MNHEFRKGWRAACKEVAKALRARGEPFLAEEDVCYQPIEVRNILRLAANDIEAMPCPGTVTVVDEEGRRLL